MLLKSILRRQYPQPRFVYGSIRWRDPTRRELLVELRPRRGCRPRCSGCRRPGTTHGRLAPRQFDFIPILGIAVTFFYAMRRVDCRACRRVVVEQVPWARGKEQMTEAYKWFLAGWAKRLAWSEVARLFGTSWDRVYRAVRHAVLWGLAHRDQTLPVEAIGVDEIAAHKGHRYLTLIYQIDGRIRRLLWVGVGRSEDSLSDGLQRIRWALPSLKHVCSDMAPGYLKAIATWAGHAVHVLDRFHVTMQLSKAIDQVRAQEVKRLKADGKEPVLTHSRWCLLKRPDRLTEGQASKLKELLRLNLRTVRAYLLRRSFEQFWDSADPDTAQRFLRTWTTQALRSRLPPMRRIAKTLRRHEPLLLNGFRARGQISNGITEGLNNKAKIALRKSYGFRTDEVYQVVLYHQLGALPEHEFAHRFR